VTDLDEERGKGLADELGAQWVEPDAIYDVECDVFAPCALGAVINDDTLDRLKCRIVAGSANNQLQEPRHGLELKRRGILYAPDFVINGGGVINVADEFHPDGYHPDRAYARIRGIGDQLREIIATAAREDIPTSEAADRVALARLELLSRVRRTYIPE
jgi:leucine dehydrogenase